MAVRPSHSRCPCQILRTLTQKWNIPAVACCSNSWDVGILFLVVRNLQMLLGMETIHCLQGCTELFIQKSLLLLFQM